MMKISRHEGAKSLWSGLGPTLILALPATVIYFVLYEQLRVRIKDQYFKAYPGPCHISQKLEYFGINNNIVFKSHRPAQRRYALLHSTGGGNVGAHLLRHRCKSHGAGPHQDAVATDELLW